MKEQFSSQFRTYSKTTLALLHLASWLVQKKLTPPIQPLRCKTKTKHDLVTRVFPAHGAVCLFLPWVLIGPLASFHLLWLADMITMVLLS